MTVTRDYFFSVYFRSFLLIITTGFCYAVVRDYISTRILNPTTIKISLIIVAVLFVGFSTKEFLKVDMKKKTIFEYVWFLGWKIGSKKHFDMLEKIFINRNRYVKQTYVMLKLPFIFDKKHVEYSFDSFLKLKSGEKIKFLSNPDKDLLIGELRKVNQHLRTSIYDNTSGQGVRIF